MALTDNHLKFNTPNLQTSFWSVKPVTICVVIKQNESEVGSDMLLVSEVLFRFNVNVKPDTCRKCLVDYTQI